MHYFEQILRDLEVLDKQASAYLSQFEFIPTPDICARIERKCWDIFGECGEDYDRISSLYEDELESVLDGTMPYLAYALKPGSLKKSLGLSVVSVDAHLRNLLERLEGRTTEKLPFGIEVA